ILYTHWNDKRVIAMSDCLWGVLDGINDSGLALSLAFGGRKVVGDGFGAPIILRYILEFCETVKDAADVLCRVPTHMSYNITVTDRSGRYITAMIAPDRKTSIKRSAVATNHQKKKIEWHAHALASETLVRERQLSILVADARMTEERLISAFTDAPLFRRDYRRGLGTVYSAAYWPGSGQARFFWPSHRLDLSFENFVEQTVQIEYDQKRKRSGHGSQV
ncbi:C45 family peptidase, partial [Aquisalimonas sp.]|uniref:C45 family peptidase n=1 Tax=Aquisalimonas sp. TaxID=1872621 RepID=UPI0025BFA57D